MNIFEMVGKVEEEIKRIEANIGNGAQIRNLRIDTDKTSPTKIIFDGRLFVKIGNVDAKFYLEIKAVSDDRGTPSKYIETIIHNFTSFMTSLDPRGVEE